MQYPLASKVDARCDKYKYRQTQVVCSHFYWFCVYSRAAQCDGNKHSWCLAIEQITEVTLPSIRTVYRELSLLYHAPQLFSWYFIDTQPLLGWFGLTTSNMVPRWNLTIASTFVRKKILSWACQIKISERTFFFLPLVPLLNPSLMRHDQQPTWVGKTS